MAAGDAQAVLVTGVYGAGKSTVVADIGALLEARGAPYGVLDVDWLGWFDAGGGEAKHLQVVQANLAAVCGAYLAAGVRQIALAWSIGNARQLDAVRLAVPASLRVVHLDVDAALVERRLSSDPTAGRHDDMLVAKQWLATGRGVGLADLVLPGDRPVRVTSEAICRWLDWID